MELHFYLYTLIRRRFFWRKGLDKKVVNFLKIYFNGWIVYFRIVGFWYNPWTFEASKLQIYSRNLIFFNENSMKKFLKVSIFVLRWTLGCIKRVRAIKPSLSPKVHSNTAILIISIKLYCRIKKRFPCDLEVKLSRP